MTWRIEFDNHQVRDWFDAVIWTDDNRVVARIPQATPLWSDEANARVAADAELIAAAPEQAAEIERLTAEVERLRDGNDAFLADNVRLREKVERLRAALEAVAMHGLNVAGCAEAYNETESAHLWQEVADIAEVALDAPPVESQT